MTQICCFTAISNLTHATSTVSSCWLSHFRQWQCQVLGFSRWCYRTAHRYFFSSFSVSYPPASWQACRQTVSKNSLPATSAFCRFLEHSRLFRVTGHWFLRFLLPLMLFPWFSLWLAPPCTSVLILNITLPGALPGLRCLNQYSSPLPVTSQHIVLS